MLVRGFAAPGIRLHIAGFAHIRPEGQPTPSPTSRIQRRKLDHEACLQRKRFGKAHQLIETRGAWRKTPASSPGNVGEARDMQSVICAASAALKHWS
jgi:hypothetical protein